MAEFKDRLEEALTMRDMKPSELSKRTGIGEGAISQYRKGNYKASQRNLDKISKVLNVSIPWLMGVSDDPSRSSPSTISPLSRSEDAPPIENPDIRMIARAGRKMTPEQAENVRKYAEFMFPEAFKDDDT